MNRATRTLESLVQTRASADNSSEEAKMLISLGADITVQDNGRHLVSIVAEEEFRLRSSQPESAENCLKLIKVLQEEASLCLEKVLNSSELFDKEKIKGWISMVADPEAVDEDGNTFLCRAVRKCNIDLVEVLVECGCYTLHTNKDGHTPFDIADRSEESRGTLRNVLEKRGQDDECRKLIESGLSNTTIDKISQLLDQGVNINYKIASHGSLLHLVIKSGATWEIIDAFINRFNADLDVMDSAGYRAIEICVMHDKDPYELVEKFIKNSGMNASLFYNRRLRKKLVKFSEDHKDVIVANLIRSVLNEQAWMYIFNNLKPDASAAIITTTIEEMISLGVEKDFLHNHENYMKWSLLHLICERGNLILVQSFVTNLKVKYQLENGNGDYPIAVAARNGHLSIVDYLRKLPESKLDVKNTIGETLLHLAIKGQHLSVVQYLVRWGADAHAKNVDGKTALDMVKSNMLTKTGDPILNNKLMEYLEALNLPVEHVSTERQANIDIDQEACEIPESVSISGLIRITNDLKGKGNESSRFFSGSCNEYLYESAKKGNPSDVQKAIKEGADIIFSKDGLNSHHIATVERNRLNQRAKSTDLSPNERKQVEEKIEMYDDVIRRISEHAKTKIIEALEKSQIVLLLAYVRIEPRLIPDLLYRVCQTLDSPDLVHNLFEYEGIFVMAYKYDGKRSPYQVAKDRKHHRTAAYIKFRLSQQCTEAINANNVSFVKQLVRAGASVDMSQTNNINTALKYRNLELIEFLCDMGAKGSMEWSNNMDSIKDSSVVACIKRSLCNRRLRTAAARGEIEVVRSCHRDGADINSTNCHGSTAVLCAIKGGNHLEVVRFLVSSGASIVHSNPDEKPLIEVAIEKEYKDIAKYLKDQLNFQYILSIINGNRKDAEQYLALGANVNFQDKQKRTGLHYAVQYHGIDLVTWLCDSGSLQAFADENGDYPLTLATRKGDYAVVELLIKQCPGIVNTKNPIVLKSLQIAIDKNHKRIEQILRTGKSLVSSDDGKRYMGPRHSLEMLRDAATKGNIGIIKEFCEDVYESKDKKRHICFVLLFLASAHKQFDVIDILGRHYNIDLKPDALSKIELGEYLHLNDDERRVFYGFLSGISSAITESSVLIDPHDPSTYERLFDDLASKLVDQIKHLENIDDSKHTEKAYRQECEKMNNITDKIRSNLMNMGDKKAETIILINECEQKLSSEAQMGELDRKNLIKKREVYKSDLHVYKSIINISERKLENIEKRRRMLDSICNDTNLFLFYNTIENRLQAFLQKVYDAQFGRSSSIPSTNILAFSEVVMRYVNNSNESIWQNLNENHNKELASTSIMGNISEMNRIASDIAKIMTLYYKEPIQSINNQEKIKRISLYREKFKWIENILMGATNRKMKVSPVIVVADFITAWVIHSLKCDKNEFSFYKPISEQLWYLLAKKDIFKHRNRLYFSDVVTRQSYEQKIPLREDHPATGASETPLCVEMPFLIGCVSLVNHEKQIYQYTSFDESPESYLNQLKHVGFVYPSCFTNDHSMVELIVAGRTMSRADAELVNDIDEKLKETYLVTNSLISQAMTQSEEHYVAKTLAAEIIVLLRDKNIFSDVKNVQSSLNDFQQSLEVHFKKVNHKMDDAVKSLMKSTTDTLDKVKTELDQIKRSADQECEVRYKELGRKISEHTSNLDAAIKRTIDSRRKKAQALIETKLREMNTIAQANGTPSKQTRTLADEADNISKRAKTTSTEAEKLYEEALVINEDIRTEMQAVIRKFESANNQKVKENSDAVNYHGFHIDYMYGESLRISKQKNQEVGKNVKFSENTIKDEHKKISKLEKTIHKTSSELDVLMEKMEREYEELRNMCANLTEEASRASRNSRRADEEAVNLSTKLQRALERVTNLQANH